jgi:hypothetical protein
VGGGIFDDFLCARAQGRQRVRVFWAGFNEAIFGLRKPFSAVGDYVIIVLFRPVETAYFELIFHGFLGIILLHNS